jgi:dTDP-4-dehydrorhamnose 3,5-epimerase
MFKIRRTEIRGFVELQPIVRTDVRGSFVKTFHDDVFRENDLETDFREQYYSVSTGGVLRGLHFQLPPRDHAKLVFCPVGEIMDVAVDLRADSPTFGRYDVIRVSAEQGNEAYVARGLAHGFYVLSIRAIVVYNVTSTYDPEHDAGVRWDSVGIPWPSPAPTLSDRDKTLPTFAEFDSPFRLGSREAGGAA